MIILPLSRVLVSVLAAAFLTPGAAAAQVSAKALFYDPAGGRLEASAGVPPSPATGLTPVRPYEPTTVRLNDGGSLPQVIQPQFFGIHYWFENDQGNRFSDARAARVGGARVRLHIRSNADAWLTVWMADESGGGVQLTPMDGPWPGYSLKADSEYIVPGDFTVPPANAGARVLCLLTRFQGHQVASAADARREIQQISATVGRDGALSVVWETDTATPGQVGTYVVNRKFHQLGAEIEIRR